MKYEADACFMKNAMSMGNGENFAKHLGSFAKQFKIVKVYIIKALEKIHKQSLILNHMIFLKLSSNMW